MAIADAARRVEAGELDEHFPVDVYQTGSGTSTNMNVNEVLAALAQRSLGHRVPHPNDHVNASQSSNDTVPTAIRLAVSRQLADEVHPAVASLAAAFRTLAERFRHVVKAGRTHLMDATPVTLGQEAAAWAGLLERALARSRADLDVLGRAAARRDRRRDGHQRAGRVRRGGDRRAGGGDRPATATGRRSDGPPGWPGRPGRGVGRPARHRRGADEDRQRHPPAGQRPVVRAGRTAAARAAGRFVDHAGKGQPRAVRVRQPGGGTSVRQRRDGDLRRLARNLGAEHVPARDGRCAARVGVAAGQRVSGVRAEVRGGHRGRRGAMPQLRRAHVGAGNGAQSAHRVRPRGRARAHRRRPGSLDHRGGDRGRGPRSRRDPPGARPDVDDRHQAA